MGSTVKTLTTLMRLTETGALPAGGAICDIGATQLFAKGDPAGPRAFLDFYAGRSDRAVPAASVEESVLAGIADGGYLGELLELAGFTYTALDIFHGKNTILFDLNVHAPGRNLAGRFDLVMNLGTTEHVFNQLRAFETIHALAKVGGALYHDLPMAGYFNHALFRYDPMFFRLVADSNAYEVVEQTVSGPWGAAPVPPEVRAMGYREPTIADVGIEVVYRKRNEAPFKVMLEMSTALALAPGFFELQPDENIEIPQGFSVHYAIGGGSGTLKELMGRIPRSVLLRLRRLAGR